MVSTNNHKKKSSSRTGDSLQNLVAAITIFLDQLQVKVTPGTIRELVSGHPSAPSMAAAVEVLNDWGLETMALKCSTAELVQLAFPSLTLLLKNGGSYVVLRGVKDGRVQLTDPQAGEISLPYAEFEKQWSGYVVMATAGEHAGEADYPEAKGRERRLRLQKWVLLGGSIALFAYSLAVTAVKASGDLSIPALLGVKLIGLWLTGLLVWQSISPDASLPGRLCPKGRKTDCGAVLNSAAAKLFGWLPLTDVGLLYFAGGILSLILAGLGGNTVPVTRLLALLILPALPFTLFSVYYQARVLKIWCRLCLGVQLLFWVEFLLMKQHLPGGFATLTGQSFFILALGFGIAAFLWMALRLLANLRRQADYWRYRYLRLSRNPGVLRQLLQLQEEVILPDALQQVAVGAPDAPYSLTLFTQPSCNYCAEAHRELEQLIARFPDHLAANILFWVGEKHTPEENRLARYATALMIADEAEQALAVLADWFADPDRVPLERIDAHAAQHRGLYQQTEETLRQIDRWATANHINGTPARYLNGRLIPQDVQLTDLIYLLKQTT